MTAFLDTAANLILPTFTVHTGSFRPVDDQGNHAYRADHFPYVVLRLGTDEEFSGNHRADPTLANQITATEIPIIATYAGLTHEALQVVKNGTRTILNRTALAVPGWRCSPLQQRPRTGPAEDVSVHVDHLHPWFAVDEYRFIATKES